MLSKLTDLQEEKSHGVQPTFHNTRLFSHFPKELSDGYFRFEGNGKIPFGRQGKSSAQLAVVLLNSDSHRADLFCQLPKENFPFPSNLRQLQLSSFGKFKEKNQYSILGLNAMPLSLKNLLLRSIECGYIKIQCKN